MEPLTRISVILGVLLLASCSHAPPQVVQVFDQVDRVFDPATQAWSERLSAFVQASSSDGTKVFDRLHLIHDAQNLFVTVGRSQWVSVDRPGEYWVGVKDLGFPGGKVPTGEWRAMLVTRAGQKVEIRFQVPPTGPGAKAPRTSGVTVQPADLTGQYSVAGWVDDYLVWARDAKGQLIARNKTLGPSFQVPQGTATFVLYSYDKDRGEGLEAGPFPVQEPR